MVQGRVEIEAASAEEARGIAGKLEVGFGPLGRNDDPDLADEYEFEPDSTEVLKMCEPFDVETGK